MPAVRILVASDRIGALSSRRAGEAIASGWPEAEVRVYPVGEAGGGFVEAFADASGTRVDSVADAAGVMTATVASPPAAGSVDAPGAPVDLASSRSAVSWEPAMASADPLPDGETRFLSAVRSAERWRNEHPSCTSISPVRSSTMPAPASSPLSVRSVTSHWIAERCRWRR